jgi:probable phosphoglycerate mutase
MQLIFTRHGESQANTNGIISNRDLPHGLTDKGFSQGMALAEQLASANIHTIYSSPILRAQQTAELVAKRLDLSFHLSSALREFDCSVMEGRGDEAAWLAHRTVVAAWDAGNHAAHLEDGESFNDVEIRFVPFIENLVLQYRHKEGAILLISHGAVLQHMLPVVLSNVTRAFTKQQSLGNCAVIIAEARGEILSCTSWDNVKL